LTFAQGEEPDALSKTIRHPVPEYLDVLVVTSRNEIFPGTKPSTKFRGWPFVPRMDEIFSEIGEYVLTVAITGDGVPTETALLKFTWTQNWQTAALTLITESSLQPAPQLKTNLEIQLESEGGLISARITNRNDSEVRVEDLWVATVDATGKKTLARNRIRKFKRCAQMPHVMPPHSSFEVVFNLSDAGFHSYAQAHPYHAQTEYWVEVKLEDGTVLSGDHRQVRIGSNQPTGLEPQPLIVAIDELKALRSDGEKMFRGYYVSQYPTREAVEDYITKTRECARQKALQNLVRPKDLAKFEEPWEIDEPMLRKKAELHDAGHVDFNALVDPHLNETFNRLYGHIERLKEIIATIEFR
jgi:hypothetical protein